MSTTRIAVTGETSYDVLVGAGVVEAANLTRVARALDLRHLLLGALAPHDGRAARHQVVASVAVLDLDDVAGSTETGSLTSGMFLRYDSSLPIETPATFFDRLKPSTVPLTAPWLAEETES